MNWTRKSLTLDQMTKSPLDQRFHFSASPSPTPLTNLLPAASLLMNISSPLSLSTSPILASRAWHRRTSVSLSRSHLVPSTPRISLFKYDLQRSSPIVMSSDGLRSNSPVNQLEFRELKDESDFETILSPDGYLSICGFGSLLSGTYNTIALYNHHCRNHFGNGAFWRQREVPEVLSLIW